MNIIERIKSKFNKKDKYTIKVEEIRTLGRDKKFCKKYGDGYRIIYFYEKKHAAGSFAKKIKDFANDFDDGYTFTNKEALLDKYLETDRKVKCIAIYKTDGTLVTRKIRED